MEIGNEKLVEKIQELIDVQALEIVHCPMLKEDALFIPYMMNDAVEDYIVLEHCKVFGHRRKDFPTETTVEILKKEQVNGLILRLPDKEFVTIWFTSACEENTFYQYHGIGHFWRTGSEQWRQLVYASGTVFDKKNYMKETSCNEKEQAFSELMGFAPFRFFSPVKESLDDKYCDTKEGLRRMKNLAKMAEDASFLRALYVYQIGMCIPFSPKGYLVRWMAGKMECPERVRLYDEIRRLWEEASSPYQIRQYPPEMMEAIRQQRNEVSQTLSLAGFQGSYPYFYKDTMCIVAAEEHPFVIEELDYEDFCFKIQFMVSFSDKKTPNAGFFEGNGEIIKNLKELIEKAERK